MNAKGGPSEGRRAKEGASADSAEEMKNTPGLRPWKLHFDFSLLGKRTVVCWRLRTISLLLSKIRSSRVT